MDYNTVPTRVKSPVSHGPVPPSYLDPGQLASLPKPTRRDDRKPQTYMSAAPSPRSEPRFYMSAPNYRSGDAVVDLLQERGGFNRAGAEATAWMLAPEVMSALSAARGTGRVAYGNYTGRDDMVTDGYWDLGMSALGAPALFKSVGRNVGRYVDWINEGVPEAKAHLLDEMLKYSRRRGAGPSEVRSPEALEPLVRETDSLRASFQSSADLERILGDRSSTDLERLTGDRPSPPSSPPSSPARVNPSQMNPPAQTAMTVADPAATAPLAPETIRSPGSDLRYGADGFPVFFDDQLSEWARKVSTSYGIPEGDIRALVDDPRFKYFQFGDSPAETIETARRLPRLKKLVEDVTEPGEIIVGGSPGISSEGTLWRPSVIPHDIDFSAYAANASRRTGKTAADVNEMVKALSNRSNIENAPVIAKLRNLYPELKNAKFRFAEYDWQYSPHSPLGSQYVDGVFTVPLAKPSTTPTGEVNMLVTTKIGGENIDIMLSDGKIATSRVNPRYGDAQTAFHWKAAYGRKGPKDRVDASRFTPLSEHNRTVDLVSGRGQSSFDRIPDRIMEDNGMPVVFDMETFPGSGVREPVIVNTRGEVLPLHRANTVLSWYDRSHPRFDPLHSGPADSATHPIVAIRGANPAIRDNPGFRGGEAAPHIGLYPANNPDELAAAAVRGDGWTRNNDVLVYGQRPVDPDFNVGATVWDTNARTGFYSLDPAVTDPKQMERLMRQQISDRTGTRYTSGSTVPPYLHIDSAYRRALYRQNPDGGLVPERGGFGYGEALPSGFVKDKYVFRRADIDRYPTRYRKLIADAIRKSMFAVPAAAALGPTAADALGYDTEE